MNTTIHNFISTYGLRPADAIIAGKNGWNILDHYVIYMGYQNGFHWFMGNISQHGVRYFSENEIASLLTQFTPKKFKRFQGTEWEREQAIQRAHSQMNKPYSLFGSNCEHFANYVQTGQRKSVQANFGLGIGLFVFGAFIASALSDNGDSSSKRKSYRKRY